MSTQPELQQSTPTPLEQYASYPFDTDEVYQQGLASILASGALANAATPEDRDEILRRTRVFYFNKTTGNSITLDEAREFEESLPKEAPSQLGTSTTTSPLATAPGPTPTSDKTQSEEEPRVLTFAELKELIESGRLDQIPNNKIIPNDLNEAPPSQSTTQTRKKPWEIASENSDVMVSTTELPTETQ